MIKNLLWFVYQYLTNSSFRNLCDSAMNFNKAIDDHINTFGAEKRSSQWPKVRDAHLKIDPVCNVCGTKEDLNVHHIIPFHIDRSKELDPDNLITLCNSNRCHFTFGHLFNWSTFNPNVKSDAKAFKQKKAVAHESI